MFGKSEDLKVTEILFNCVVNTQVKKSSKSQIEFLTGPRKANLKLCTAQETWKNKPYLLTDIVWYKILHSDMLC